jgi:hypothetical protein
VLEQTFTCQATNIMPMVTAWEESHAGDYYPFSVAAVEITPGIVTRRPAVLTNVYNWVLYFTARSTFTQTALGMGITRSKMMTKNRTVVFFLIGVPELTSGVETMSHRTSLQSG